VYFIIAPRAHFSQPFDWHNKAVQPFDPVVFERTTQVDSIVYAAATQIAADLLTSSGRGPEEAEWILEWMEEHENAWRA
jgi:hypothetical protein